MERARVGAARVLVALGVLVVVALGLGSYALGGLDAVQGLVAGKAGGQGQQGAAGSAGSLSEDEVEAILYVREEEKLARDVYLKLYEMWGLPVFKNISESEQRHMDSVLGLIEKYGLEDPVVDEVGVFTNPEIQELYDELVERGSQSLEDAILVGGLIEEMDIVDLSRMIEETDNGDIIQVFENLMQGSINHLKAFAKWYEDVSGEEYEPQLLDDATFSEVMQQGHGGPKR